MTKIDLINGISGKLKLPKKNVASIVAEVFGSIERALAKGEKCTFVGFGVFEVKDRAARKGINPRTKEPMPIPASKLPAFKAGKALKEAVNVSAKKK